MDTHSWTPRDGSSGTVLLIGATSGIMSALSREMALGGYDLVLAGRDCAELGALASDLRIRYGVSTRVRRVDALAFDTHGEVIQACIADAGGRLAGAVVGIGYLGDQKRAEQDDAEARRILDVNLTACVSLLTPLANHFEEARDGFLCVLSSVAGERGRQSNYVYGSAKAGLSAFLSGLRNRLHHSGVQVTTILPGFVDTGMTYGKEGMFLVASPEAAARGIARAIARKKAVAYVPFFWRGIMAVIRAIPENLFKRLRL